jgi:hypothetical protein
MRFLMRHLLGCWSLIGVGCLLLEASRDFHCWYFCSLEALQRVMW